MKQELKRENIFHQVLFTFISEGANLLQGLNKYFLGKLNYINSITLLTKRKCLLDRIVIIIILLIVQFGFGEIYAQRGYSSAAVSMNRANGIIAPNQVIIEEYLNYHTHKIPLPKANEELALELRWGNDILTRQNKYAVLQIGIATKQVTDYSEMPRINTSIVIDKSGSMTEDRKLEKVKAALLKFIQGLRPDDIVSIIVYDSRAWVALPAQQVKYWNKIKMVINSISPGGSTNLNGGMQLGYEEVMKNFNINHSNRVILLTDGIANQGVTNPEQIVANSVYYNKRGIDISTIGVGNNINYTLLQQIARKGKGLNHFIGNNEEDIKKVFEDELESLLSPVAKDVVLEIEFPASFEIEEILGYSPIIRGNKVNFNLNNLNSGLTQVVLVKFRIDDEPNEKLAIRARLNYYSHYDRKTNEITKETSIEYKKY